MKRIIIVFLALFLVVPLVAQKSSGTEVKTGLQKGYQFSIDIGGQLGVFRDNSGSLKLTLINGYQFNPHFSIGLGTGFFYDWYDRDCSGIIGTLLPVYADFRINFLNSKVSPYFSMALGILISYPGQTYTGDYASFEIDQPLINPMIGLSYKITKSMNLNVGFGFHLSGSQSNVGPGCY